MKVSPPEFFLSTLPSLSEEGCRFLCDSVEEYSFAEGEQLFAKGEAVTGLYFLLSGRIGIKKETGFEDKTQIIALLDPGAPIGERGLLQEVAEVVHGAGAIAVVPSQLVFLSAAAYSEVSQKFPHDGRLLLEWVLLQTSRRLEKASERLAHIL